ncbi:MAG: hypothetical protein AB7F36_10620 [Reyranellaceae bacterium]
MPRYSLSACLLATVLVSAPLALAQPADQGLVVCGGQKTTIGEKKKGEISFHDKKKTIEKDLRAAGYNQRKYAELHWSDLAWMLKGMPEKYVAFYDRGIKEQGPNLVFGELGARNKVAEVAKFCAVAKPMKVCEDFTAC